MNCDFIVKRYYTKHFPINLFAFPPKPKPIIFLRLNFHGIFNYSNTYLFFKVWPFTQNLILKVRCKFIFFHTAIINEPAGK